MQYREVSKFPSVVLDKNFIGNENEIYERIMKNKFVILSEVRNKYKDKVCFRIWFQRLDRTMTKEEAIEQLDLI